MPGRLKKSLAALILIVSAVIPSPPPFTPPVSISLPQPPAPDPILSRLYSPRPSPTRASRSRISPRPTPTVTYSKNLTVAPRRIVPRNELQRLALAAALHYHIDPSDFFDVIKCESEWDPNAWNPDGCEGYGCGGLTQQHMRYWKERAARAGFPGASVFNAKANLYVGAAVAAGGWHHYSQCL